MARQRGGERARTQHCSPFLLHGQLQLEDGGVVDHSFVRLQKQQALESG